MKSKLNCVLLIDDDYTTSFITEIVVKQVDCTHKIVKVSNGNEALNYLQSSDEETHPKPELILLDINMPVMNGWEFMEEYQKDVQMQKSPVIMMLSSSRDESDQQKAEDNSKITALLEKPFNHENMETILKNHFC